MKAIFRQEWKMNLKNLLYWCIGMILLIAVAIAEYSSVVNTDPENSIMPMLLAMPKIIRVMFGMNALPIDTPMGYYACMLLWFQFVAFFHAAFLGSSILAKEERDRTADYIFTKPYSRSTVITGKILAAVTHMLLLTIITWGLSVTAFGNPENFDSIQKNIFLLMLGMFIVQLLFFSLSLLFSAIAKTQKKSASLSMTSVLFSYLIGVTIEYQNLPALDALSFFRYFHAAGIQNDGLRILYIGLSLGLFGIFLTIAYRLYDKRDLQV